MKYTKFSLSKMKVPFSKGLIAIIIVFMVMASIPFSAQTTNQYTILEEWQIGDNVRATLFNSGLLKISGEGDTYQYTQQNQSPFYEMRSQILKIEIEDTITTIGDYLFYNCFNLSGKLTIPSLVSYIGENAFNGESNSNSPKFNLIINHFISDINKQEIKESAFCHYNGVFYSKETNESFNTLLNKIGYFQARQLKIVTYVDLLGNKVSKESVQTDQGILLESLLDEFKDVNNFEGWKISQETDVIYNEWQYCPIPDSKEIVVYLSVKEEEKLAEENLESNQENLLLPNEVENQNSNLKDTINNLYYDGKYFYTNSACTSEYVLKDNVGKELEKFQQVIDQMVGDINVYMKATYKVSQVEKISGVAGKKVSLFREANYTGEFIRVERIGNLTFSDITLDGGAVWSGTESVEVGRGIKNNGIKAQSSLIIVEGKARLGSGVILQNNENISDIIAGGAVSVLPNAYLELDNASIKNNSNIKTSNAVISLGGGGIYIQDARVDILAATVTGNYSNYRGGGIFVNQGSLNIYDGSISKNQAGEATNGGGIHNWGATVNVYGGETSYNSAKEGGGIHNYNNENLTNYCNIYGGSVNDNIAEIGAGIFCGGSNNMHTLNITGGVITQNYATANIRTSGIYLYSSQGNCSISGGTIINNKSQVSSSKASDIYKPLDIYIGNADNTLTTYMKCVITGGSIGEIDSTGNLKTIISDGEKPIYKNTITLTKSEVDSTIEANAKVVDITNNLTTSHSYGSKDVISDGSGNVYLWLPTDVITSRITTTDKSFYGTCQSASSGVNANFYQSKYIYVNGSLTMGNNDGSSPQNAFKDLKSAFNSVQTETLNTTIVITGLTQITEDLNINKDIVITSVVGTTDYRLTNNAKIIRNTSYAGVLFTINTSVLFINVTVDGNKDNIKANTPMIVVESKGVVIVQQGASLQNNFNQASAGYGGAVLVQYNGIFYLRGGTVLGNTATYGGGLSVTGKSFIESGKITQNTGTIYSGGVHLNGEFQMTGGSISNNISENGGGITLGQSAKNVIIQGGVIENNQAANSGGAIRVQNNKCTITGGTIRNNTDKLQSAIYVSNITGTDASSISVGDTVKLEDGQNIYLTDEKKVNIISPLMRSIKISIIGEKWEPDRIVATYASGITPNINEFYTSDQKYTFKINSQNIQLTYAAIKATIPLNITTAIKADGTIVTPDSSSYCIQSTTKARIQIKSILWQPQSDISSIIKKPTDLKITINDYDISNGSIQDVSLKNWIATASDGVTSTKIPLKLGISISKGNGLVVEDPTIAHSLGRIVYVIGYSD